MTSHRHDLLPQPPLLACGSSGNTVACVNELSVSQRQPQISYEECKKKHFEDETKTARGLALVSLWPLVCPAAAQGQ